MSLAPQMDRQFGGHRGFADALQTDEGYGMRCFPTECQRGGGAQQFHQGLMHDLDQLLARSQAFQNLGPQGAFPDLARERLDYLVVHIRFQQRQADRAQTFLDIRLGQQPLAAQSVKDVLQFARQ